MQVLVGLRGPIRRKFTIHSTTSMTVVRNGVSTLKGKILHYRMTNAKKSLRMMNIVTISLVDLPLSITPPREWILPMASNPMAQPSLLACLKLLHRHCRQTSLCPPPHREWIPQMKFHPMTYRHCRQTSQCPPPHREWIPLMAFHPMAQPSWSQCC